MGQYSWMYADTKNRVSLKIFGAAYVPFPDGTVIYERSYGGYGMFMGQDIYELVAEWNRNNISEENIRKPVRKEYGSGEQADIYYQNAVKRYEFKCRRLRDFVNGNPEMEKTYGDDWKRNIGIDIACYDEDNAGLKFPIKICKKRPNSYETVPASNSDPEQGR